jgi:diadenylate cyclase
VLEPTWSVEGLTSWRVWLDIAIVGVLIYQLLYLLRGSRSGAILVAISLIFGLFYVSQDDVLDLPTVNWLLDRFLSSIVVLLVILFQDDIRRGLSAGVQTRLSFGRGQATSRQVLDEVLQACSVLGQRGIGALLVLEREADLDRFIEHGVRADARVTWQLLLSLFIPSHLNPTHDGAVIIRGERVAAAACFLPLASGPGLPSSMGSRHRAGLGLADETDALVIVVSEESGAYALAHLGQIEMDLTLADLRERLEELLRDKEPSKGWQGAWRRRVLRRASDAAGRSTAPVAPQPSANPTRSARTGTVGVLPPGMRKTQELTPEERGDSNPALRAMPDPSGAERETSERVRTANPTPAAPSVEASPTPGDEPKATTREPTP